MVNIFCFTLNAQSTLFIRIKTSNVNSIETLMEVNKYICESDEKYQVSNSAHLAFSSWTGLTTMSACDNIQVCFFQEKMFFTRKNSSGYWMAIDLKEPGVCFMRYSVISLKYKFWITKIKTQTLNTKIYSIIESFVRI